MRKYLFIIVSLSLVFLAFQLFVPGLNDEKVTDTPSETTTTSPKEVRKNEHPKVNALTIDLQKEIDEVSASGGGVIKIPEGEVLLDKPLILKTGVHLSGAGIGKTIIKIKEKAEGSSENNLNILKAQEGSVDIGISEVTFDGEKESRMHLENDPKTQVIVFSRVQNFSIEQIEVVNAPSASIMLFHVNDGVISKSRIKDSGSNGIIGLQDIDNVKITNNSIENTTHQNGIFISYQEGRSSSNILIEGNTVKNAGDFGIEVGHTVEDGHEQHEYITVKNNKVIDSRNAGIAFRTVSHGVIENNTVEGYGRTGGYGADGIFVEGLYNQSTDVKVLNNTVKQTAKTGDANGIFVTGLTETLVEGNIVTKSRGKGLFIQASNIGKPTNDFPNSLRLVSEISVNKNEFVDNLLEGIHVQGFSANNISISENIISKNQSHGLNIANLEVGNELSITNNEINENGLTGVEIYLQNDFIIEGNKIVNNGKEAEGDEFRTAVKLVSIGQGKLINNYYEDNQPKPTQTYYLQILNANSSVRQSGKELVGGTKLLKNDTDLYYEGSN